MKIEARKSRKSRLRGIPRSTQKGGKSTQMVVGSVVAATLRKGGHGGRKGRMQMSKPGKIQRKSIKISHASASDKTTQKGVPGPSFGRSGGDIYYEKTSKHDRGKKH